MDRLPRIMVAPNGARRTTADHENIPVTIPQTVAVAQKCYLAGAKGIHAHVRDEKQKHVLDAGLYKELITEIASQVPDMFVQITTEAVGEYSPSQQRQLIKDVMPKAVSIAIKEMISDGDQKAARQAYYDAQDRGICVQHIVYSDCELSQLLQLVDNGIVPQGPQQLLFVLGRYTKNQQSEPAMLNPFLEVLSQQDQQHDWAVCAFGVGETQCLEAALKAGGKTRVGFENSLLNADGSLASGNEERVREIAGLL